MVFTTSTVLLCGVISLQYYHETHEPDEHDDLTVKRKGPVKGDIPIHLMETIISKRLKFLKAILKERTCVYNEYVIEGSLYDNVGHFLLCIVSILGKSTEFYHFFTIAEIKLFQRRLFSLSSYDTRCFAKRLLRGIKKYGNAIFSQPLQTLCQHLMIKNITQHICSSQHHVNCSQHTIETSFKNCLTFISQRQVELRNGIAIIPCGKWMQYLIFLFSENFKYRINNTDLEQLKRDPRITDLIEKTRRDFFPSMKSNINVLLSVDVDSRLKFFPPCMLNLHQNLRKKHRLSHMQRFHYSLFLKDIGMPVEEAIDFWKAEYQQQPNGSHSCCHNWEKDEKKFVYGIRHMYGLEGGRKNYASVNCQSIQSNDGSCSEGGCPFKSFDDLKMFNLLNLKCTDYLLQINELGRKRQYTSACISFLEWNVSKHIDCDIGFNFTPVKYYLLATANDIME